MKTYIIINRLVVIQFKYYKYNYFPNDNNYYKNNEYYDNSGYCITPFAP